jgi:hypothetical protein
MTRRDTAALSDTALSWFERCLWALCIAVYLGVFIPGVLGRGDELLVMARAIGVTLATALLGKLGLALLAQASLPAEEGPSAEKAGPIGSLVEIAPSTNVPEQKDGAEAA